MGVGRVDWRVRLPFGDIEIELHPVSVDAATREASVREVSIKCVFPGADTLLCGCDGATAGRMQFTRIDLKKPIVKPDRKMTW